MANERDRNRPEFDGEFGERDIPNPFLEPEEETPLPDIPGFYPEEEPLPDLEPEEEPLPDIEPESGFSSQAGLAARSGRSSVQVLSSVPAPGQPGSRFNPRVVSREEQAERRTLGREGADAAQAARVAAPVAKKNLGIPRHPPAAEVIDRVPDFTKEHEGGGDFVDLISDAATGGPEKQGVVSSATKGFMAGAQMSQRRGLPGRSATPNPTKAKVKGQQADVPRPWVPEPTETYTMSAQEQAAGYVAGGTAAPGTDPKLNKPFVPPHMPTVSGEYDRAMAERDAARNEPSQAFGGKSFNEINEQPWERADKQLRAEREAMEAQSGARMTPAELEDVNESLLESVNEGYSRAPATSSAPRVIAAGAQAALPDSERKVKAAGAESSIPDGSRKVVMNADHKASIEAIDAAGNDGLESTGDDYGR